MNHLKTVKLVADIALFFDNKVLLVKYKDKNKYDHQSGWFLPDDYIAEGEHPEDSASRILNEQLALDNHNPEFDHFESFIGNDNSWHLIMHFKIYLDSEPKLIPMEDIEKFEWFDMKLLPNDSEIAHHGWAKFTIKEISNRKV